MYYSNNVKIPNLFIYLFIKRIPTPATPELARISARERGKKERHGKETKKSKGIEPQRGKPPTPSRAIDALKVDEEQNEKEKKGTGSSPQPCYPGPSGRLLRPPMITQ